MSSPVRDAKLAAAANGFVDVKARHRTGITLRNPSTGKCCFESQVGQIYHRLDGQEACSDWGAGVAPWQYQMTGCDFHLFALSRFDQGQILKWLDPVSGKYVTFQPMALQWTNDLDQIQQISMPQSVVAQVSGDELYWPDAYGLKRHFKYVASTSKLNKLLILEEGSLPATSYDTLGLNFIMAMSSGVTPYIDSGSGLQAWDKKTQRDTVKAIEFRLTDGTVIWSFAAPTAYDSSNDIETGSTTGTIRLKKRGGSLYVSVRFPKAWLDAAQYPVMIDPTVDYQVGASADDGLWHDWDFSASYNIVGVGYTIDSALNSWARFPSVVLPVGCTIDVANIQLYYHSSEGTQLESRIYFNDSDNPIAPVSGSDANGKTKTTAYAAYTPPTSGTWVTTASVIPGIEELLATYDYSSGLPVMVLLIGASSGSGSQIAYFRSYNYTGNAHGPKLHIEYTEAAGGNPFYAYAQQ